MDRVIIAAIITAIAMIIAAFIGKRKIWKRDSGVKKYKNKKTSQTDITPSAGTDKLEPISAEDTKKLLDAAFSSKVDKIANKLYEDLKKIERDCPDPEEAIRFIRHFIESELQDAEEGIICCEQSERDSMKPANPKDPNQVLGSAVGIMAFGQIIADQRRRKRAMEAMLKEINNISKQNIEISQVVAKLCKIAQFYLSK